jgi:serine/threonine-protein kinase
MPVKDLPQSSPLIPGYRLDRYELLCPIAVGGMAEAWVARLQGKFGFEKLVAVKTILPEFAADPRFQRMFLDEARIASRIEHTNVAQTLDLGEERGVLYLVMEWVDGEALRKIHQVVEQKEESLPRGILLRIVADVCGGLHAAHELRGVDGSPLNVVHRDVSPQNILVSARGEAKLIDFGVAKARDRVAGDTNSGILKGKVLYMAPEQALGREVDRRADLWAVGALLYHLLTGRPPYDGPNPLATLHLLTSGAPPPPLPADVPEPIARVVLRALSHSVDARPATAAQMQAEIERAMVEVNVPTTIADVAGFIALHLAERAARRKQALELALGAALERVRIQPLLKLPRNDSIHEISGVADVAPAIDIEVALPEADGSVEEPLAAPSAWSSVSMADARRALSGVTAHRRVLAAMAGAIVCAASAAVVLASGAETRHVRTAARGGTPSLAASIRARAAVPDDRARSVVPAPSDRDPEPPADALEARAACASSPNPAPHPTPRSPPTPARTGAPSTTPTVVTSIPEVIDYGF